MTATDAMPQVPPGTFCANPPFAESGGPDEGEYYGCQGQVVGAFSYHPCGLVQGPDQRTPSRKHPSTAQSPGTVFSLGNPGCADGTVKAGASFIPPWT